MDQPTCATCRHFRKRLDGPDWHCHRFPPREGDIAITYPHDMFCGEHAPTPAVGVPGLPELPPGWTWADEDHTEARHAGFGLRVIVRGAVGREVVAIVGNVRADVVEMAIARHRAGGAA